MSNAETNMKIGHMNNLRISLIFAYLVPIVIFFIPTHAFLYKEILFFLLDNIMRDIIPSFWVCGSAAVIIFFIYNEVMLKPLFMRCRGGIHDYRLKYEAIDFLFRWIFWNIVVDLIIFGEGYLVYSSELSGLGWRAFIEFRTTYLTILLSGCLILLVITLFICLWWAGANYIEKDTFEDWLEADFPSFPIKFAAVAFFLTLAGSFFVQVYIHFFINPGILSPTLTISVASMILALLPLYYYLFKRIVSRFIERHELR